MSSPIHADLLAILDAVNVLSLSVYTIQGERREVSEPLREGVAPPRAKALENDLYARLYMRPSAPEHVAAYDFLARRDFLAALSAANSGRGTWEPGWTIRRVEDDGRVAVDKDGITFWAFPEGVRVSEGAARPGVVCRVWVGKELRGLLPGFYLAIGDAEGDEEEAGGAHVRLYWHLTRAQAVPFMERVTHELNWAGTPFRVKVLSDPHAYHRADAGVLYLRRRDLDRIGDSIARIYQSVATGLRPEVPMFTRRLAEGLGMADDPAGGLSFGEHRCRLIAEALWRSFVPGGPDGDRFATLANAFRDAGLDPAFPHLGPGSRDDDRLAQALKAWRP